MGNLIDISDLLEVRREVREYDRERQIRAQEALMRIYSILVDVRIVLNAYGLVDE